MSGNADNYGGVTAEEVETVFMVAKINRNFCESK
jgi:hypothetical protein